MATRDSDNTTADTDDDTGSPPSAADLRAQSVNANSDTAEEKAKGSRTRKARSSGKSASEPEPFTGGVPRVAVRVGRDQPFTLRIRERKADGTPVRYALRKTPHPDKPGMYYMERVRDSRGTEYNFQREMRIQGGSQAMLYADDVAGMVWKGYVEYLPQTDSGQASQITEEELLDRWVPPEVKRARPEPVLA